LYFCYTEMIVQYIY